MKVPLLDYEPRTPFNEIKPSRGSTRVPTGKHIVVRYQNYTHKGTVVRVVRVTGGQQGWHQGTYR